MPEEVAADELQTASSSKYHRNHAPYTARIKKMMQADEDVGKVAKASPILISKALDEFLHALLDGAAAVAQERGAKTLTSSHLKAHITAHPLLDFCLEAVKDVADLPPAEAAESGPRATKKRSKSAAEDGEPPTPKARRGRKKTTESQAEAPLEPAKPEPMEEDGAVQVKQEADAGAAQPKQEAEAGAADESPEHAEQPDAEPPEAAGDVLDEEDDHDADE
ncbi:hypothetical protein QBZ16_004382 [Prototheca wickerhamii]|uniref:Transcription factor CBF/NF-Y/archaeal histone domain-containing protein n=1 Tax=Prototheca wickerhamii TaxID=3111 RepID=A0AAD9MHY3_PROWI|nr:hypothetical protein QBZ16_004382 [Prototheca wickerhamii]